MGIKKYTNDDPANIKAAGDLYIDADNSKIYTAFGNQRDSSNLTQLLTGSGVGDMTKAVYDTGTVEADAFTMTNMNGGNWKIPYTDGSGDITELALGAAGTVLRGGGAAAAPTWGTVDISTDTNLTASSGVDLTLDNLTAVPGEIDHDSLLNFVADEHIAHSGVTITAGDGLTGGGAIETNRTIDAVGGSGITASANSLDLDINSLGAETIVAGDFVPFWDITATATNKKTTFTNFEAALTLDNQLGTLSVGKGGTGAATFGDGYVLLGSGAGAITALDVTTKGSIMVGDGTTDPVALAVGTNTHILIADSTQASGVKWGANTGGTGEINFESGTVTVTGGGGDVTVNLSAISDWTGGHLIVVLSDTSTDWAETTANVGYSCQTSYDALTNAGYNDAQGIYSFGDTSSPFGGASTEPKTANFSGWAKSATTTSFTLDDDGATTRYVKWFVWA